MRILSWNVNGLRSVQRRSFDDWLERENPDVLCLQEIKAQEHEVSRDLFAPRTHELYLNSGLRKGHSGVAVFTRHTPIRIRTILGVERFDGEGRMLQLELRNLIVLCLYLPHGGRSQVNLPYKLDVYTYLLDYLKEIRHENVVLAGDFNIAHLDIDLARPRQNRTNVMFTKDERGQIDSIIALGFQDSFREFHKDGQQYTWWPYMAEARSRNVGWRIDYLFTSGPLRPRLTGAFILNDVLGSDHCPIGIELSD